MKPSNQFATMREFVQAANYIESNRDRGILAKASGVYEVKILCYSPLSLFLDHADDMTVPAYKTLQFKKQVVVKDGCAFESFVPMFEVLI